LQFFEHYFLVFIALHAAMCAECPQIKAQIACAFHVLYSSTFEFKQQAASESKVHQHLRFVSKLPEHGPKEQRDSNREREPCGIVRRRPPKGYEELLEADQVLLLGAAGVLGVKV